VARAAAVGVVLQPSNNIQAPTESPDAVTSIAVVSKDGLPPPGSNTYPNVPLGSPYSLNGTSRMQDNARPCVATVPDSPLTVPDRPPTVPERPVSLPSSELRVAFSFQRWWSVG
jgi:hypothetical protein